MSLQVFSNPVSLASLTLLHLGVSMAANLGGFEDDPNATTDSGNDGKDTTAAKDTAAKETPAKDTAAKETAAKETAATETAAKDTAGKDTATGTTVWWTPATPTTATATTTNKAESQKTADSKTTGATSSAKYNQYGFLGSQSVWQASTLESSTSGSSSVASIHNKTSGANVVRGHVIPNRDSTLQKAVLIGGFVGVGLLFQAL